MLALGIFYGWHEMEIEAYTFRYFLYNNGFDSQRINPNISSKALLLFGTMIGSILTGLCTVKFGRKIPLLFITGPMIVIISQHVFLLHFEMLAFYFQLISLDWLFIQFIWTYILFIPSIISIGGSVFWWHMDYCTIIHNGNIK